MVREHYVIVISTNHVTAFCLELYVSNESHIKYIYIIGRKHSYVMLSNHTSLSHPRNTWPLMAFKVRSQQPSPQGKVMFAKVTLDPVLCVAPLAL